MKPYIETDVLLYAGATYIVVALIAVSNPILVAGGLFLVAGLLGRLLETLRL